MEQITKNQGNLPLKRPAKYNSFSFIKALMLCFFINGVIYIVNRAFDLLNMYTSFVSSIAYLIIVIAIIYKSDKQELRRIFAWRKISFPEFAAVLIMFCGAIILYFKLCQIIPLFLPVPDGFWSSWYDNPSNYFLLIISVCFFPGFTEELFFRGLVLRRFYSTYSPFKALIFSSVIFGLMHINPWQMITTTFMGILLGWIYIRYKSIWLCMFLHALNNFISISVVFPSIEKYNSGFYTYTVMQPLWFDFIGLVLFLFGLTFILLLRKETVPRKKTAEGVLCPQVVGK